MCIRDRYDSDYSDPEETNLTWTLVKKEFINRTRRQYETLRELWDRVSYVNVHTLGKEIGLMGNDIMKKVNERVHSYNYTDAYLKANYNCTAREIYAIKYWHTKSKGLSDKMRSLFRNLRAMIVE